MIEFFMVDVKDIQVNTTEHNFSPTVIENLADAMLASGGLIKPLILKQVSLQSYQLIDGHLEYYAALQAKAKDPRKGEMVNAFVISPDQEDLVRQQVTVLQSAHPIPDHAPINSVTITSPPSNNLPSNNLSVTDYTQLTSQLDAKLDTKFNNYSQVIQNQLRQNQQDLQLALQKMQYAWETTLNNQLRQQREEIQAQLRSHSPSTPPVATPAKISEPLLEVKEKTPVTQNGLSPEKANIKKININEVETYEHFEELKEEYNIPKLGLAKGKFEAIIDFRQKQGGRIVSLEQLAKVNGITKKMMDEKEWSDYLTC